MRVPDRAGGLGGADDPPDDLPLPRGTAWEEWRGWARDVAVVLHRVWRTTAAVLLVTTVLPALPVSGLVADGAALGQARAGWGKSFGPALSALLAAPVVLVLGAGCGLIVVCGWAGAVWAAGSGRPLGVGHALAWGWRRFWLLGGIYLAGVAVLVGAAFRSGLTAPGASTLPNVLALAGLLAPVLCLAPAVAWRRPGPRAGDPDPADGAPAARWRWARLAPMGLVLAVVVSGEVAIALALSWLMTPASAEVSARISAPAAALIASLAAVPGSVLLTAASAVSYARLPGQWETLAQLP